MNIEFFIAKRLNKRDLTTRSLSYLIIRITTVAIALSVATMIISEAIVIGFRSGIQNKLSDFVGHVVVSREKIYSSYEMLPVPLDSSVINKILQTPDVEHVQVYAIKPGLVKHDNAIQGVVLKGIWKDFNWDDFSQYMEEGSKIDFPEDKPSKQIIISSELARIMDYKLGDNVYMLFVQDPPRLRKFKIAGIYNTGLVDFDKIYILADIREIQKLNNWTDSSGFMISGYEVFVKDFKKINDVTEQLKRSVAFGLQNLDYKLDVSSIFMLYPDIFTWLSMVDMNVVVILTIMLIVALMNMTTGLLIIILEKTRLIGVLKALGATNASIRKIFLYNSVFMLSRGLFWGNVISLAIIFIQKYFHVIPLNPEIYYVKYVPMDINFWSWFLINAGTVLITVVFMIIPATVATKVDPVKTMKFE